MAHWVGIVHERANRVFINEPEAPYSDKYNNFNKYVLLISKNCNKKVRKQSFGYANFNILRNLGISNLINIVELMHDLAFVCLQQ